MGKKDKKKSVIVKEEEIDLGKLFSMIGDIFYNFFNFIWRVLKGVFHYFILLLIFIRTHIFKLLLITFVGAFIGLLLDKSSPKEYTYDMIIEPNYHSIDQIYENMEYYNVLVKNEDTVTLNKQFNISYSNAKSILKFELLPYETRKDQIIAYDSFLKETDSLTHEYFSFYDFITDKVSKFDSKQYVYRIQSSNPKMEIFGDKILSDIEKSPTLQKRKRIRLSTLKLDSIAARLALREIDSLRLLYKKVTLLEVEKEQIPNSSTYLNFSKEANSNNNDLELFKITKGLNEKLIQIESKKETSEDIVNVITPFNSSGKEIGTIYDTKTFILGCLFGGLALLFFLLMSLNKYLKNYSK